VNDGCRACGVARACAVSGRRFFPSISRFTKWLGAWRRLSVPSGGGTESATPGDDGDTGGLPVAVNSRRGWSICWRPRHPEMPFCVAVPLPVNVYLVARRLTLLVAYAILPACCSLPPASGGWRTGCAGEGQLWAKLRKGGRRTCGVAGRVAEDVPHRLSDVISFCDVYTVSPACRFLAYCCAVGASPVALKALLSLSLLPALPSRTPV